MSTSGVDYVEIGFRNFSQNNFMGPFAYSTDSFIEGLPNISKINVGVMSDASIFLTDEAQALEREMGGNPPTARFRKEVLAYDEFDPSNPIKYIKDQIKRDGF